MTQPSEAVGGANDTVVAAEPTIEDRFAALAGDEGQEEEKRQEEGEEGEESVTLTAEDLPEEGDEGGEAEGSEEEAPSPIAAPASWTAAEKEEFAQLPPAVQKTVARREAEREKFVQAKSQEAAQTRSAVEREAYTALEQIKSQHEAQLQLLIPQIPDKPSYQLQIDDPEMWAAQMEHHERAVAQYQWVQQQLGSVQAAKMQAQQNLFQIEQAETAQVLAVQFPEYLDATNGPKLRQELGSTAMELGYTAEQLANVDHRDILAMRTAHDWRQKAEKYDALMSKKMATVRAARGLPRVSRPGVPQGKGAAESQRYAQDRERMKGGDKDAGVRVFSKFL